MTSLLESYSWVLAPEKMPNLAFLPHQVLKPGGSPFYFRSSSVKECRSTLELRSKARMLFNSDQHDQPGGNGGPRWIRTTDLTLIRRAL